MREIIEKTLTKFNLECNDMVIDFYESAIEDIFDFDFSGRNVDYYVNAHGADRDALKRIIETWQDIQD